MLRLASREVHTIGRAPSHKARHEWAMCCLFDRDGDTHLAQRRPQCVNHCASPTRPQGPPLARDAPCSRYQCPSCNITLSLALAPPGCLAQPLPPLTPVPGITVRIPTRTPFFLSRELRRVTAPNLRNFLSPRTRGVDADVQATKRHADSTRRNECTYHVIVDSTIKIRNS
jgi:hypothetical protein